MQSYRKEPTLDELRRLQRSKIYSSGQVAKLCGVAPRTVTKWFDSGKLKGFKIPGSNDRRIPRAQLLHFMKQHGIPAVSIGAHRMAVMINVRPQWVEAFDMRIGGLLEVKSVANLYAAMLPFLENLPEVVVIDTSLGLGACGEAVAVMRGVCPDTKFVGLLADDLGVDAGSAFFDIRVSSDMSPVTTAGLVIDRLPASFHEE